MHFYSDRFKISIHSEMNRLRRVEAFKKHPLISYPSFPFSEQVDEHTVQHG